MAAPPLPQQSYNITFRNTCTGEPIEGEVFVFVFVSLCLNNIIIIIIITFGFFANLGLIESSKFASGYSYLFPVA